MNIVSKVHLKFCNIFNHLFKRNTIIIDENADIKYFRDKVKKSIGIPKWIFPDDNE